MTCGHCKKFVSDVISELKGVQSSEVSLEQHFARVTFDDALTSREEIVKAVNDTHSYKAE